MEVIDLDGTPIVSSPEENTFERRGNRDPTYVRMGRLSASMLFGTSYISGGVLSGNIMEEIEKRKTDPDSIKALTELQLGNVALTRRIALDPHFIAKQPAFVQSGQLLKVALSKGHLDLAIDLVRAGYYLSPKVMLEAISEHNSAMVLNALSKRLYEPQNTPLFFWWIIFNKCYEEAAMFVEQDEGALHYSRGVDITSPEAVNRLLYDAGLLKISLKQALELGLDEIASKILGVDPSAIDLQCLKTAVDTVCLEFLRKVWSGKHDLKGDDVSHKRSKTSVIWNKLGENVEGKDLSEILNISNLIEAFLAKGNVEAVNKVLTWPDAVAEKNLLLLLLKNSQQGLAKYVLRQKGIIVNPQDFRTAFDAGNYDICVDMLKYRSVRLALSSSDLQETLLELLSSGETCLQAIEILSVIPVLDWRLHLTKELIQRMSNLIKKTSEIIVCPEPLLFCALSAEFLTRISAASLQFENKCVEAAYSFIELGDFIEEAYRDEDELSYALSKTDSQGRSVLTITSRNGFLKLLENDEIGTIVTKMWIGRRRSYGLGAASTIWKSFVSPSGSEEAFQFMHRIDKNKPYSFHFEQWTESCSQRYLAQGVSAGFLVFFYQMLIYTAISNQSFNNVASDSTSVVYLRICQVWVLGIFVEVVLSIVFAWKTGRLIEIDNWKKLDITMFVTMVLLMIGVQNYVAGNGNLGITPSFLNALGHSFMMLMTWLRVMAYLLSTKRFGPFLRMMYLMMRQLVTFLIVFLCITLCGAAVFTALFYQSSNSFSDFNTSFRTLFGSALGDYNLEIFSEYIAVATIMLGIWLLIGFVLLLQLLVALLTNIYKNVYQRVDAEYRLVLVSFFNRYRWDENYGLLIFMPSPLSLIVFACVPFLVFSGNPRALNTAMCKVFYIIFAIPQFVFYLILSCASIPLLFCKGFVIFGKLGKYRKAKKARQVIHVEENAEAEEAAKKPAVRTGFSVMKCAGWLIAGPFLLTWAVIRDSFEFWAILYQSLDALETKEYRLEQFVTSKFISDVQLVLSSIRTSDVSASQLVEQILMLDNSEHQEEGSADSRHALASDFFNQFAKAQNDPMIEVQLIRRLLPDRPGNFYDEEYLLRAQHIHIPWLNKGVKRYQQKIGSIVIGGVPIPKTLGVGSSLLSKENLEILQRAARDLDHKLFTAMSNTRALATMMEEHARRLSKLTGNQEAPEERDSAW